MATEDRRGDPAVVEQLLTAPYGFGFFQAVRLLRLALRSKGLRPTLGVRERIRFRTPLSLEFPASEIQALERKAAPSSLEQDDPGILEMTVNFMGLTGPSGVLPNHYTETLIASQFHYREPVRGRSSGAHWFLDLFSHRLIALFADAWRKYRFWLKYEEGDRGGLTRYLLDIVGLGSDQLRRLLRDQGGKGLPDEAIAYYSGLLAQRPISCSAATAVLAGYFGADVVIEQFRGRWLELPHEVRTTLGGANAVLGESAVLGSRAWEQQSKIRIRIGPLDYSKFQELLPIGSGHGALGGLARFLAGTGLDYDIQLVLKKEQVPACVPGTKEMGGARLGWSSWLRSQQPGAPKKPIAYGRNPEDVVLAP
jgi:type VI secretion system protein ImpH